LPADTRKVVVLDYTDNKDKWTEDQKTSRMNGITPEWAWELIEHELAPLASNIKNRFPDAEIYFTSFYPLGKDFGHARQKQIPQRVKEMGFNRYH